MNFWETRPQVVGHEPLCAEEEAFALACLASARRASLRDPQDVRVFTDDKIVNPTRVDPYLPSLEHDTGFAGYARRLRSQAGSFALTINSLQQFDWGFWRTLRRHTDPVLAATGAWSAGGVDCHLIASVYGTAPTLIHKDTAGVFTYVLHGFKRYYTWPYEVFAGQAGPEALQRQVNLPHHLRYQDHLDTATVVEGGPGTVLYWPSDRWHCATSDGDLAVSVHIAHYQWDDRLAWLLRRLRRTAEAELGVARFDGDAQVRKTVAGHLDDAALGLEVRLGRLRRSTASNFEVVPEPRPGRELAADDPLTVPAQSSVAAVTDDGLTYLAANGHLMRVTGGAWVDSFLPELAPGVTRAFGEWRDLAGPGAATLVGELVRRGALEPA
ncbi:hypothetical protein [Nonomuraea sp. NPDC050643]|uniref:hypothetical protein n=1 Tax=Nonomuraea sp. NPDC050643 TaxID=3155660 RepID=UPI0033C254F1